MKNSKYFFYEYSLKLLLHLPQIFYGILFEVAFPVYKIFHKKKAYGRVENHLKNAGINVSAKSVFKGIYYNALESYKGLAYQKKITNKLIIKNESVILEAIKKGAVVSMSIHQGAFELLHRSLARYSQNVHLITDSVGNEEFRKCLENLRFNKNIKEYHPNHVGLLIKNFLKTKGVLAIVVDQGKNTKGNPVNLFNQKSTLFLRLPLKVNQMGASIVTFRTYSEYSNFIFFKKLKHIVISFENYHPAKSEPTKLVNEISKEIECWIKEHPEQWSWNYHKNFS